MKGPSNALVTAVVVLIIRMASSRKKCKIFNHKCTKCGIPGHSEKYCHKGTPDSMAAATKDALAPALTSLPVRWALCGQWILQWDHPELHNFGVQEEGGGIGFLIWEDSFAPCASQ